MPVTIKKNSQNVEAVILLQAMLKELEYSVVINGAFDDAVEKEVEQFQLANNLIADGIVGPKTWHVLYLRSEEYLATTSNRFIEEIDLINAAKSLGIEVATIKAINEVESRGMGFVHDFPVILFERHIFWRRLKSYGEDPSLLVTAENRDILNKKSGGYRSSAQEIKRLERAQLIHKKAALESASWGLFQIMGYHWKVLGYPSIENFVKKMKQNEVEHLKAFVRYIKKNNLASNLQLKQDQEHLNLRHFERFAKGYNGVNYAKNRYHTKMLSAYRRYYTKNESFFSELANIFINAGWNQDSIQNAILEQLLDSFYSPTNIDKKESQHRQAYDAVRGDKLYHPLYQIRKSEDLLDVNRESTGFFIRDFMQVRSQGGKSLDAPMVIGKRAQNGLNREGLHISDGILKSDFAEHFNWIVEGVNKNLAQQNIQHKARRLEHMAHRDAIQLIPFSPTASHFAGATMQYVQVEGNEISSAGQLQGIFATDGSFKNLQICNNSIAIRGSHFISISGMLSGKIEGNTDINRALLPKEKVKLWPLRIGGGVNIYILSFANAPHLNKTDADYYAYEKITGSQEITDLRELPVNKRNATNWENVDMITLQKNYETVAKQVKKLRKQGASQQQIKNKWQNMMLQIGDEVIV